jgi:RNA polymerase sigma-70 factor (ECF subfamily)
MRLEDSASVRLVVNDRELVDAISRGDATAPRMFELRYVAELRRIATRLGVREGTDELVQRLLVRMLVGSPDAPPKIAGFRGDGSLDAWVRAVATRFVIDHVRHTRAQLPTAELSESAVARSAPIDGAIQHDRYAAIVRASAEHAFAELSPRERNLLRHAVFHRLSVDEVGSIYRVHRATAARWLQRARDRLHASIVRGLCDETGMPAVDARSIVREVGGVDVSLHSMLPADFEPDEAIAV